MLACSPLPGISPVFDASCRAKARVALAGCRSSAEWRQQAGVHHRASYALSMINRINAPKLRGQGRRRPGLPESRSDQFLPQKHAGRTSTPASHPPVVTSPLHNILRKRQAPHTLRHWAFIRGFKQLSMASVICQAKAHDASEVKTITRNTFPPRCPIGPGHVCCPSTCSKRQTRYRGRGPRDIGKMPTRQEKNYSGQMGQSRRSATAAAHRAWDQADHFIPPLYGRDPITRIGQNSGKSGACFQCGKDGCASFQPRGIRPTDLHSGQQISTRSLF